MSAGFRHQKLPWCTMPFSLAFSSLDSGKLPLLLMTSVALSCTAFRARA